MSFGTWVSSLHPRQGGRFIRTNFGGPAKKAVAGVRRAGGAAHRRAAAAGIRARGVGGRAITGGRRAGARVGAGAQRVGRSTASPFKKLHAANRRMRERRRAEAADWAIGYAQTPEELAIARERQAARDAATRDHPPTPAKKAARKATKKATPPAKKAAKKATPAKRTPAKKAAKAAPRRAPAKKAAPRVRRRRRR